MSAMLETMILIIVLGSFLAWGLSFYVSGKWATIAGFVAVALVVVLGRYLAPVLFAYAIFSPIGIVLPALALSRLALRLGFSVKPFSMLELLVGLVLLMIFYMSAAGFTQTDLYGFGYSAMGATALCLGVCVYGLVAGRMSAIAIALIAKLLWMMSLLSDNIFDVFGHFVLVFVILVELLSRLFGLDGTKFSQGRGRPEAG